MDIVGQVRVTMTAETEAALVARLRAAAQSVCDDEYAQANEYVRGCLATKMVFARELIEEFFPEERDDV